WPSTSPPTSRAGRTAPRSSSTAASASITSDPMTDADVNVHSVDPRHGAIGKVIPVNPGHAGVGADVGGSGIKVGVVDVARGELLAPRLRVVTPEPSTPAAVVPAIVRTIRPAMRGVGAAVPADAPVGVGVPCVVIRR